LAAGDVPAGAVAATAVVSYLGSVLPLGDTDLSPYFYSRALVMLIASRGVHRAGLAGNADVAARCDQERHVAARAARTPT
jgi:hypothetical protein